jgi:hypothetical protein
MSTLKADTIQSTSGGAATLTKQFASKSWTYITGDGSPTIGGSFNTSSVTDVASANITSTFTNSMSDTNFCFEAHIQEESYAGAIQELTTTSGRVRTTSSVHTTTHNITGPSQADSDGRNHLVHGDLA